MTLGRKHNYQAWLVPYAEGTLDAARAALLEAQMARDPALSAEAGRVRAVTHQLRRAAALSTSEADPRLALDPAPLWPGIQTRLAAKPRCLPHPAQWAGGVCAASLALAALLLHGPLSGVGTLQTPPPAPVRTANVGSAPVADTQTAARQRRKKAGHRLHARPAPLAFGTVKPLLPARLAARSSLPPPAPDAPALPVPAPNPAAPSAHTAAALEDGSPHFRLASPVLSPMQGSRPRPASDSPAGSADANTPAQDQPAPLGNSAQTQAEPAPAPDPVASTPAAPPAPAVSRARQKRRHRGRRRHAARRPAASVAIPASDVSPAMPTAAPLGPRSPRLL